MFHKYIRRNLIDTDADDLLYLAGGPTTCTKGSGWGSNAGRYGIEEYLFNKAVSLYPTDTTSNH